MVRSKLFENKNYQRIQENIKEYINSQSDFLSERTISSTRAVGDAIQNLIEDGFPEILNDVIVNYYSNFPRRAMEDLAFTDQEGNYYAVDIKTHRLDTDFNMPNLISVKRLSEFYENQKNYFIILAIAYSVDQIQITAEQVYFVPIEFFDWDCLTLAALGWCQIQIANSNTITLNEHGSRKQWMIRMCDNLFNFYNKELSKIEDRIESFQRVKENWQQKEE